jgi:ferredoxin
MSPSTSLAPSISIHADRCRHDGLCAKVCPVRIFTAAEGAAPAVAHAERCVRCGQCLAICPHEAIAHDRLDRARFTPIEHQRPVEAAAALELIRQRRSVRVYRAIPCPGSCSSA